MNWHSFQWRSLKTKITLVTLGTFLAGLWSLSFYASQMLRSDMQHLLGEQQFATVSMVSSQVNRQLEMRLNALNEIARLSAQSMLAGPVAMQAYIEQRPYLQSLFNGGAYVMRPDGTVIADLPLSAERLGVNYMDRDFIAIALREGRSNIGRPVMGKKAQAPVFVMTAPILDAQDRVIGALAGLTNLEFPNFLDQITESRYGKTGGYLLIAPQYRLIVTSSDKSRIMETLRVPSDSLLSDRFAQGHEGSGVAINPRGVEVLASAKGIPIAGWYAVAALPTAEAFAPIREMQRRMRLATILLTLLSAAVTWWLLRRHLSPLLATAKTLATMADAEQPPQPLAIVRNDEIGQLIGGFNRLLDTLGQREALLKQVLDTSSVAIFLVDMDGRITQANQRMGEMFRTPADALLGTEYVALVHPSERDVAERKIRDLLSSTILSVDLDRLYWRADQTEFWGRLTGKRFYGANGEERGLVGVIADISARTQARQALLKSKQQYDNLAAKIPVGIYILRSTPEGAYALDYASPRMAEMFSISIARLLAGRDAAAGVIHPDDVDGFISRNRESLRDRTAFDWNGRVLAGERVKWLHVTSLPEPQENGDVLWHGLVTDITERREYQRQLEHIAHYDVLTTLPNRVLLADRLHQAMSQEQRRGQRLAVAYLDLDGFKAINDTYGHETGDQLLIALAGSMKQTLRESDTLARLGGDEFVVVLLDLDSVAASLPMLERLLAAAARSVRIGELTLQVSASLGVSFYPQTDDVDADQLLRQAD